MPKEPKLAEPWKPSDPTLRTLSEDAAVETLQLWCWPFETAADLSSTRSLAHDALEHLIRLGLPHAVARGRRMFEPYEVSNFMVWLHRRRGDPFWVERCVAAQRLISKEYFDGRDRRFGVAFERELLRVGQPGKSVRTQLALPREGSPQRDIDLRFAGSPAAHMVRTDDSLDVRARAPAEGAPPLRIELDTAFRSGSYGEVVEPDRVEPFRSPAPSDGTYLSASEGPIKVTDPIRSLAREIAGGARTPFEALKRFWDYFYAHMTVGLVPYDTLPDADLLSGVLQLGWADCWLASALLVAFCRACGVPARMVYGWLLYRTSVSGHYWFEVRVPPYGWLPCDVALSWACAGGDLRDEWSHLFLGRVDPRLVVERFPRSRLLLGPRFPKRFFVRSYAIHGGTEATTCDRDDDSVVFRDRLWLRSCTPVR